MKRHLGTGLDRLDLRRSAAAVALLTAASVALTGCGRDDDKSAGGEAQSDAIAEGEAKGEIEVWAMGTEGEMLEEFSAAFEDANPDADVKVTAIPWESAHDKIAGAIASGETPDVSLIGTTWMGEFAEAGGLMPTPEGLVDEADFFPGAWGSTEVGGTSYGVPWYVETRVLYYRSDIAAEAGWDEAPQTWDDLKQFATDLEEKGGAEFGLNLQPGQTGSWQSVMPFAWSNGVELTNGTAPSTRSTPRRWSRRSTSTRPSSRTGSRPSASSTLASSRAASPTALTAPSSPARGTPVWSRTPA